MDVWSIASGKRAATSRDSLSRPASSGQAACHRPIHTSKSIHPQTPFRGILDEPSSRACAPAWLVSLQHVRIVSTKRENSGPGIANAQSLTQLGGVLCVAKRSQRDIALVLPKSAGGDHAVRDFVHSRSCLYTALEGVARVHYAPGLESSGRASQS